MIKKHLFYVDLIVEVPITITVQAEDENDAFGRAMDGAWQSVMRHDWDKAKPKKLGPITKGPGIN